MIHYTNHLLRKLPYELLLAAMFMMLLAGVGPHNPMTGVVGSLLFGLCFCVALIRHWLADHDNAAMIAHDRVEALAGKVHEYLMAREDVDIWRGQRDLMAASDQLLPTSPTMHKGSLLYLALVSEELSETLVVQSAELHHYLDTVGQGDWSAVHHIEEWQALKEVEMRMQRAAAEAEQFAGGMRGLLSYVTSDWSFLLGHKGAVDTLDGASDMAVVVAGFGLSSGLPVREAYTEVTGSNLSKANPVTGRIDKDTSGKWIKGRNYRAPDLGAVLARAAQRGAGHE